MGLFSKAAMGAAFAQKLGLSILSSTMVTAFPPKITILLWVLAVASAFPAVPAEPSEQAGGGQSRQQVRIAEVGGDGIILTEDGAEIVLAGLDQAYRLVAPNKLYVALLRRQKNRSPDWTVVAARSDRYGRLTGQVHAGDGLWLQEHVIQRGAARFAGGVATPDSRRALLAAEDAARRAGNGLWGSGHWMVYDAGAPRDIPNGFRIVTGTVRRVARVGRMNFVNFGDAWRTDFTAGSRLRSVSGADETAGPLPLRALEGRRVRVRGVVRRYNGPYLEIVTPDQIELLGAPSE